MLNKLNQHMAITKEQVIEYFKSLNPADQKWVREELNSIPSSEKNGLTSAYDTIIQRFKTSKFVFEELSDDDVTIITSSIPNSTKIINNHNNLQKNGNSAKSPNPSNCNYENGLIDDPLRSFFILAKESHTKTQASNLNSQSLLNNINNESLDSASLASSKSIPISSIESLSGNPCDDDNQDKATESKKDPNKSIGNKVEAQKQNKDNKSANTLLHNGTLQKSDLNHSVSSSDDSDLAFLNRGKKLVSKNDASQQINKSEKKPLYNLITDDSESDSDKSSLSGIKANKTSSSKIKSRNTSTKKNSNSSIKNSLDLNGIDASIESVVKASRSPKLWPEDSVVRVKRTHSLKYKKEIERRTKKLSSHKKLKKSSNIYSYQYLLFSSSETESEYLSFYSTSDEDELSISSIDSLNEKKPTSRKKAFKAKATKTKLQKLINDPKLKMNCKVNLNAIPQNLLDTDLTASEIIEAIKPIDPALTIKKKQVMNDFDSLYESSSEDDIISSMNHSGRGAMTSNRVILTDSSDDELDDRIILDEKVTKSKKKCLKKHRKRKKISSSSSSDVSEDECDSDDDDDDDDDDEFDEASEKDEGEGKADLKKKSPKKLKKSKKVDKKSAKKGKKMSKKGTNKKLKNKESKSDNDFENSSEGCSNEENENKLKDDKLKKKKYKNLPKGRKNIRKPISEKQLSGQTREAKKKEEERIKRINEKKQLEYNELEPNKKDTISSLVLDYDPKSRKPRIEVNSKLVKYIKKHQYEGIKFMWDCAIESVEKLKEGHGSGCILAHCMGLGKTFQVITFLYTLYTNNLTKNIIKRALIIVPVNTLQNWRAEFDKWITNEGLDQLFLHEMGDAKTYSQRETILSNWKSSGGVLIIGHNSFNALLHGKIQTKGESVCKLIEETLVDPGPDIVIVDEGHTLKNDASNFNKAVSTIKTFRRIVLTGTPLQNNLSEYHVMVNFVKPNLLGSKKEFTNRFFNPINNGQHEDSTKEDVKMMKQKIHVLNHLLRGCVQRFDFDILRPYLQHKYEYTVFIQPTDFIIDMYHYYVDNNPRRSLLKDAQNLRFICNHPGILFYTKGYKIYQNSQSSKTTAPLAAAFNDSPNVGHKDPTLLKNDDKDGPIVDNTVLPEKDLDDIEILSAIALADTDGPPDDEELQFLTSWYGKYIPQIDKDVAELSGKFALLLKILDECVIIGDKAIVVSQCLGTLNLIERYLSRRNGKVLKVGREKMKVYWKKNINYFRIDGSIDSFDRHSYVKSFNDPNNSKARLFLLATRAGGVGINLVGANRCIIFDVSWNPTNDLQAIFRIYRFGQDKPVYIYRFVTKGTIEEKIYQKQILKLGLSMRVVDKQNVERHYTKNELEAFYNKPQSCYERSMLPPKDKLLGDLILNENPYIVGYQEHDSLLQTKPEEDLSEEERALAWAEYEREKDEEYRREEELKRRREELMNEEYVNRMNEQAFRELDKFPNVRSYSARQAILLPKGTLSPVSSSNLLLPNTNQTLQQRLLPQTLSSLPHRFNSIPATQLINANLQSNFQNNRPVSLQKNLMRFPILHHRPPQPFIITPNRPVMRPNLSTNILQTRPSVSTINPVQPTPEIITPHSEDDLINAGVNERSTNNTQRAPKANPTLRDLFGEAAASHGLSLGGEAIEDLIKGRLGELDLLTCRSDDFIQLSYQSHAAGQSINPSQFLSKLLSELQNLQSILRTVSLRLAVKPKLMMTLEESNFLSICGNIITKLHNHEKTIASSRSN